MTRKGRAIDFVKRNGLHGQSIETLQAVAQALGIGPRQSRLELIKLISMKIEMEKPDVDHSRSKQVPQV